MSTHRDSEPLPTVMYALQQPCRPRLACYAASFAEAIEIPIPLRNRGRIAAYNALTAFAGPVLGVPARRLP